MAVGRLLQAAHIAYDTGRIATQLARFVVTGDYDDPEGRVLRGERK